MRKAVETTEDTDGTEEDKPGVAGHRPIGPVFGPLSVFSVLSVVTQDGSSVGSAVA